jgi:hypothetical protein
MKAAPKEVIFLLGQLVQVHHSDLMHTVSCDRKLTPMWSAPQRILECHLNAYTFETINGVQLTGRFSARRLRTFVPPLGSRMAKEEERRAVGEELEVGEDKGESREGELGLGEIGEEDNGAGGEMTK